MYTWWLMHTTMPSIFISNKNLQCYYTITFIIPPHINTHIYIHIQQIYNKKKTQKYMIAFVLM